MQKATLPEGYNLIVAAMDTPDYPCNVDFPSPLKKESSFVIIRVGISYNIMKMLVNCIGLMSMVAG